LHEVQNTLSGGQADFSSKVFELRQELFGKVNELQSFFSHNLAKKSNVDDVNEALAHKMDISSLKSSLEMKAGMSELDQLRNLTETVMKHVEQKVALKDFESHMQFNK